MTNYHTQHNKKGRSNMSGLSFVGKLANLATPTKEFQGFGRTTAQILNPDAGKNKKENYCCG